MGAFFNNYHEGLENCLYPEKSSRPGFLKCPARRGSPGR